MGVLDPCSGSDNTPLQAASVVAQARSRLGRGRFPVAAYLLRRHSTVPERPVSVPRAPHGAAAWGGPRGTRCGPAIRVRPVRARAVGPRRRCPISRCGKHGIMPPLFCPETSVLRSCERRPSPSWARPMRAAGSVEGMLPG
ncbi:UNVERIFIED_CONTAM: hypothetical protein Sangu_2849200 [Sesamum angustifolium]|uniref:Uncharacterized protein n=1 Tax=Sesamum angustifolium TaxID=2727405 RepID=A0AAW2IQG5_9LAMI